MKPIEIYTCYSPDSKKDFETLKRKTAGRKWAFLVSGEWDQSTYHQGRHCFSVRHSADGTHWAILSNGFPNRIVAAARTSGTVGLEIIAARMLRAVRDHDGDAISLSDEHGDIDFASFWKLYREKTEPAWAEIVLPANFRLPPTQSGGNQNALLQT